MQIGLSVYKKLFKLMLSEITKTNAETGEKN